MYHPFLDDPAANRPGKYIRNPFTYNGLTLNDEDDPVNSRIEINTCAASVKYVGFEEQRPDGDGSESYAITRPLLLLDFRGVIRGTSLADFADHISELAGAFDPGAISSRNGDPYLWATYSVPRVVSGVPSSYASKMELRTYSLTPPPMNQYTGDGGRFLLQMLARDPRRYGTTEQSKTGAGAATNNGNYPTQPTLTITMAGAGNAAYAASNNPANGGPDGSLTLDLSGLSGSDVVIVNMQTRSITISGVDRSDLWVAGDFFELQPGANTLAYANATNATSVMTWYDAWAL